MGKMNKGTWAASGHWKMITKRGRAIFEGAAFFYLFTSSTHFSHLLSLGYKWRQQVPPKCWQYLPDYMTAHLRRQQYSY
jgi:hypothetical protein